MDEQEVIDLYEKRTSLREIHRRTGSYPAKTLAIVKRAGVWVPRMNERKNKVDDHFFDTIDTEEKAYWLGFITADGCVHHKGPGRNHLLSINLKADDIEHLRRFASDIGFTGAVSSKIRDGTFGTQRYCSTQVYSRHIFQALGKYGVRPKKSCREVPAHETLPDHLQRHYWRGVVDGDGHLSVVLRNDRRKPGRCYAYPTLTLCGSKEMCQAFLDWLRQQGMPTKARARWQKGDLWVGAMSGLRSADAIALLYRDAGVALERKVEVAKEISPIR